MIQNIEHNILIHGFVLFLNKNKFEHSERLPENVTNHEFLHVHSILPIGYNRVT